MAEAVELPNIADMVALYLLHQICMGRPDPTTSFGFLNRKNCNAYLEELKKTYV